MNAVGASKTATGWLIDIATVVALLIACWIPTNLLLNRSWAEFPGGRVLLAPGVLLLSIGVGVFTSRVRFAKAWGFTLFLWGGWLTGDVVMLVAGFIVAVLLQLESEMRSVLTSGRTSESGGLGTIRVACLHFMVLVVLAPFLLLRPGNQIPFQPNLVPLVSGVIFLMILVLVVVAFAVVRLGSIPRELRTPSKLRRIERRGMTLIELLIVLAIISISIAGLAQSVGLATLSGGKSLDARIATAHARTTIEELRQGLRPIPAQPVRLDTQPGDLPSTLTMTSSLAPGLAMAVLEYRIGAGAAREVIQFQAVIPVREGGDS